MSADWKCWYCGGTGVDVDYAPDGSVMDVDCGCAKDRYPKGGDPYPGLRSEGLEPAREATRPEASAGGSQGNRQSGSGT